METKFWLGIAVLLYLVGFGGWIYFRWFRKKSLSSLKVGADQKLVLEQNGKKITIDYDQLKNKVIVEFTEEGMSFKVIDGLFYETVQGLPRKKELLSSRPSVIADDEDDSEESVLSEVDDDLMKELVKAKNSGVSKM